MSSSTCTKWINVKAFTLFFYYINLIAIFAETDSNHSDNLSSKLSSFTLPSGFSISIYYHNPALEETIFFQPRKMASIVYNNHSIIYVGSKSNNYPVNALVDLNNDGINDYIKPVISLSNQALDSVLIDPIEHYTYFISTTTMIICYNTNQYVLNMTDTLNCSDTVISFQTNLHTHYGVFSPNAQYLYLGLGFNPGLIRCYNMSTIRYLNKDLLPIQWDDNKYSFIIADGVRNTLGMSFHPKTNALWFTDMSDNYLYGKAIKYDIDCELNVIRNVPVTPSDNYTHFGYPCFHSKGFGNPFKRDIGKVKAVLDPEYIDSSRCVHKNESFYKLPEQALGPRASPIGTVFYDRDKYNKFDENKVIFPEKYNNVLFIALHGCADDAEYIDELNYIIGYKVIMVEIDEDNNSIKNVEDFLTGFRLEGNTSLVNNKSLNPRWSRPTFIEILYDGSMLISDDLGSAIFRITYIGVTQQNDESLYQIVLYSIIALCVIIILLIFMYYRYVKKRNEEKYKLLDNRRGSDAKQMTAL